MSVKQLEEALLSFYRRLPEGLKEATWVIACSGGPDSVALLHIAHRLSKQGKLPQVRVIHVNHGLVEEADAWQRFVGNLARHKAIPFDYERVKVVTTGQGIEAAAREARYRAFTRLSAKDEVIVLGHHLNDQVETLLFRIMRGTSAHGLAGMAPLTEYRGRWIARPWLNVARDVIMTAINDQGWQYVQDPTNDDFGFARNHIRHELVPLLEKVRPNARVNIARTAQIMRDQADLLAELAEMDLSICLEYGALRLDRYRNLSKRRRLNLLYHWWQRHAGPVRSYDWLADIDKELSQISPDTKWQQTLADGRLIVGQGRAFLLPVDWQNQLRQVDEEVIPRDEKVLQCGLWRIAFRQQAGAAAGLKWYPLAQVVKNKSLPWIACWDGKHRPLKKLFQARKIPAFLRDFWPVVQCQSGHYWLAGLGFSDVSVTGLFPQVESVSLVFDDRELKLIDKTNDIGGV
ncbi:MAG: tRNA lysidine(34) synthetase TilS [Gammaproteobacteria bacterium]|nr:MAG: tRNA lysidine(34) synthetase TilS [Gammaproteobacteria bacterium]